MIDNIENELSSNMIESEWDILTNEIGYEPNSEPEKNIIIRFRLFIIILGSGNSLYNMLLF